MATNKRKDAAALFELIDKSTLKIPKSANALKIPNWWSSKSNPPARPVPPPTALHESAAGERAAAQSSPEHGSAHPASPAVTAAVAGEHASPPQPRLFEPPPAHVAPRNTPSIRPPSASIPIPVTPTVKSPSPPLQTVLTEAAESGSTATVQRAPLRGSHAFAQPDQNVAADGIAPPAPRVFAPPTRAVDRRAWSAPRPGAFARVPGWVLFGGLAGVIIVVCSVVWLARQRDSAMAKSTGGTVAGAQPMTPTAGGPPVRPLIPAGNGASPRGGQAAPPNPGRGAPNPSAPSTAARVHEPGTVQRSADLFYIIVCSTPTLSFAQRDANYLADRGVEVSIEITAVTRGQPMYGVITVDGYKSQSEAKPHLDTVKQVGQKLKADYHLGGQGFNDALVTHVWRAGGTQQ